MPLPSSMQSVVRQRRFWTDFLFETEPDAEYAELVGCRIRFDVSRDYGLVLDLDELLGRVVLLLRQTGMQDPVEIAWDDQAHWHPHVLRWEELVAICRCVAQRDTGLPHPGLPLVLLYRFAPITVGDDAPTIFRMLERAWRSLGLFSDEEIGELSRRFDYRRAGFVWEEDAKIGWWIGQKAGLRETTGVLRYASLYTLRHPENRGFPFEPIKRLVEAAQLGP
jgi:hypothetical protein